MKSCFTVFFHIILLLEVTLAVKLVNIPNEVLVKGREKYEVKCFILIIFCVLSIGKITKKKM